VEAIMDLKRLSDGYLRHLRAIGALYCIVPVAIWFVGLVALLPFRGVYLLRLALAIAVGGYLAARANEYGVTLWLTKHRSSAGPATVVDGLLIGAAVGMACGLVPPLTNLIASNHQSEATLAIIICWLVSMLLGAVIGGWLASVGRKQIPSGAAPSAASQQVSA
jgi:hypothetical protein